MQHIQPYLDYFAANPEWAITLVFLIAFGEALLIIGLFVPSTAVLVGAGMLVGTGTLDFWHVFWATAIGAILGDQISYWAGRFFGVRLKTMWPLSRYPQLVARGEEYVKLHGGKSIAFGRFIPGVKAVVPGIVGMFGMNQMYFLIVNVSSGLVWTIAHIVPGILIGQGLSLAGELSGRLVIVLLVLLVILACAGWLIRILAARATPYRDRAMLGLSNWAKAQNAKPLRRLGRAIAPTDPRSKIILLFFATIIVGLIAFIDIMSGLFLREAVSNFDISANSLLSELRNGPADILMVAITMIGDTPVIFATIVGVIVWLIWKRNWNLAIAVFGFAVFGKCADLMLKYLVGRARPPSQLDYVGWDAYSFPSGHTVMATIAFGIVAVLVTRSMQRWSKALVYAATAMLIIAIGFSRVYLGAHWLSDVLAGMMLGSMLVAIFGVLIETLPKRTLGPIGLVGSASLACILAAWLHIGTAHTTEMQRYVATDKSIEIKLADWTVEGWKQLPTRRIDLSGQPEEVFTAQWVGSLDQLKSVVQSLNWRTIEKWTWRDGIAYLDPNASLATSPPRPALHEGLQAKLTVVTPTLETAAAFRLVLRAYKTNTKISAENVAVPVFLLSLTRETIRPSFNLYAVPRTSPTSVAEQAKVIADLSANARVKVIGQHKIVEDIQTVLMAITAP